MLFRFSCYGFLKNQRYFEPFLVLAFREKGLSFLDIGILIGFREFCIYLLDIPSGAMADLYGRRRGMILSFSAYILSFVLFALSGGLAALFPAMFLFALGEVFRTGTHKAMIFEWLRRQGRESEKVRVYGFTRSWSKIGSAVSALAAAALVFSTGRYEMIFWFCVIPYGLNIVNFLSYPKYLDGRVAGASVSPGETLRFAWSAVRQSLTRPTLRRLLAESMVFEGTFKVAKDYLQPLLRQLALALPFLAALPLLDSEWSDTQRSAVLVGIVYCALYLLMGWASRNAHRLRDRFGGEDRAVRFLWKANFLIFAALLILLLTERAALAVAGFIALGIVQNLFRPTQVSRYVAHSPPEKLATTLSVESQSKALFAALLAPLLGFAVDLGLSVDLQQASADGAGVRAFWPVAAAGLVGCAAILLTGRSRKNQKK